MSEKEKTIMYECVICNEKKKENNFVINKNKFNEIVGSYSMYCIDCKNKGKAVKRCGGKKATEKKDGDTSTPCGKIKSLDEFSLLKDGELGRNTNCKSCRNGKNKKKNVSRPPKGTIVKCSRCNQSKDESLFAANKTGNGLQSQCKECKSIEQAKRNSKFDNYITKMYATLKINAKNRDIGINITIDDIKNKYKLQNGLCAVTGTVMTHKAERQKGTVKNHHPDNISIDRINSKIGYIYDNIQLVCSHINISQWDMESSLILELAIKTIIHNLDKYSPVERSNLLQHYLEVDLNDNMTIDNIV